MSVVAQVTSVLFREDYAPISPVAKFIAIRQLYPPQSGTMDLASDVKVCSGNNCSFSRCPSELCMLLLWCTPELDVLLLGNVALNSMCSYSGCACTGCAPALYVLQH
jgi:hypothetical protein